MRCTDVYDSQILLYSNNGSSATSQCHCTSASDMSTAPICSSVQNSSVPHTVKLSLSFTSLPTKLVLKIHSGQHVEMKELLTDNTALQQHLDDIRPQLHPVYTLPGTARSSLRDLHTVGVDLLIPGICRDKVIRPSCQNLLTYARLILGEANQHSGSG